MAVQQRLLPLEQASVARWNAPPAVLARNHDVVAHVRTQANPLSSDRSLAGGGRIKTIILAIHRGSTGAIALARPAEKQVS
jgi:hypothetical protein